LWQAICKLYYSLQKFVNSATEIHLAGEIETEKRRN